MAWRMTYYYYESQECPERGALRARRVHRGIAAARVQRARVDGRGAEGPEALRGRRALDSARTPTLACSPQRKHVTGTTESLGPDPGGGRGGGREQGVADPKGAVGRGVLGLGGYRRAAILRHGIRPPAADVQHSSFTLSQ